METVASNPAEQQHYKPNIWSYDYLESMAIDDKVPICKEQIEKVRVNVVPLFDEMVGMSGLRTIDRICKLGLADLFKKEIMQYLDATASNLETNPIFINNTKTAALCFRLLRQHGYNVSPGVLTAFLGNSENNATTVDMETTTELYEASFTALEEEDLLAKGHAPLRQVGDALGLPQHWRASWFHVRQHIDGYNLEVTSNSDLLKLAKLNFGMAQAIHQTELRELIRWWRGLGLLQNISFARDRLVESFIYALGIAPEPLYECARSCATKLISFILVIDDVYDEYGSLDQLHCFTRAVDRWDHEEARHLPECMKMCFTALCSSTNEIVAEIQNKNGFNGSGPYIRKAWADFCNSMLKEARWEKEGYIPTLEEYINNAWVSSSGPLLSLVVFLSARHDLFGPENLERELEDMRDLIYYTSLIIRLCNDEATTTAKIERGDSPSSILCYMREAKVTEEVARLKIKEMISNTWRKINGELLKYSPKELSTQLLIVNTARVAHCFYHTGDGFSVQDGQLKTQIKGMLIEPLSLE